jgi:glycosyltransferase involved in cell wall biosynthesis
LRAAFTAAPDVQVLNIRNRYGGLLRYLEVTLKITVARWRDKPDAYVITFRGYEMLLFMVMTLVRKPIIFDEMVNFTEWMDEHHRLKKGTLPYRLFRRWYGRLAKHSRLILADTEAHARYSAELNRLDISRYRVIPVGTDETVFYPRKVKKPEDQPFTVFYYGHMLPLHGLPYVLEAAEMLKGQGISFRFVGGKTKVKNACAAAARNGARVTHENWLPFDKLPEAALRASLTMGGPFGDTLQSRFVITGKTYQFLALGAPAMVGRNEVNSAFQDKVNALVVPQGDARAIADAILWAYRHPTEVTKIGAQGRELYQKEYSQKVINDLVAGLVKDLVV